MPATLESSKQILPQLLGDSWPLVAEKIQRMHEGDKPLQATGEFYVRHGRWPAAWIGWIMGMPAAGETVELLLKVSQQDAHELWERSFAGRPMPLTCPRRTSTHSSCATSPIAQIWAEKASSS